MTYEDYQNATFDPEQYPVYRGKPKSDKEKIAELENKIADIKATIAEPEIERLKKENAELKEKVNILDNCDRLGDVITEAYKEQLTTATNLLKKMYYLYFDPCVTHKDLENRDKLFEEVKQFLKEIEK